MVPALMEKEAQTLASKYDFSGGQIENIARHYTISNILHGNAKNVVETLLTIATQKDLKQMRNEKLGLVYENTLKPFTVYFLN